MASAESHVHLFGPTPLPLDCVAEVIDVINDPGTLFALLTVSKSVFRLAVFRLYKDPFALEPWSQRSVNAFARFVLTLSPSTYDDVRKLRRSLGIYSHAYQPKDTLRVDYLSYMRTFRVGPSKKYERAWSAINKHMWRVLILAATAHRLSEVKHLALTHENKYITFYTKAVDQLTSLEKVTFEPRCNNDVLCFRRFLQQYVDHFGAKGRRLRVHITKAYMRNVDEVLKTLSLLDPLSSKPQAITRRDAYHYIAQRDRVDFGYVKTFTWALYEKEQVLVDMLLKCRSLKSLQLNLCNSNVRVLGWASHRELSTQAQDLSTAPTSVKSLSISGDALSAMEALGDALRGFWYSLKRVDISLKSVSKISDTNVTKVLRIDSYPQLPRLHRLSVASDVPNVSVTFRADSIPVMPQLQTLVLESRTKCRRFDPSRDDPLVIWQPLYLPCLTCLHLTGRAAAEFNPESFQYMITLQDLLLAVPTVYKDYWPADRWEWNWCYLPLKSLRLQGLVAATFHMTAIVSLPNIETLSLGFGSMTRFPWTGDLAAAIQAVKKKRAANKAGNTPWDGEDAAGLLSSTTPDLSKTLKCLELGGNCLKISDTLWQLMLGPWFPKLNELRFSGLERGPKDLIVSLCERHPQLTKCNSLTLAKP